MSIISNAGSTPAIPIKCKKIIMTETNTNGHKRISPKWLHPDQYAYLKNAAKDPHSTETSIINQALKLHEESNILHKFTSKKHFNVEGRGDIYLVDDEKRQALPGKIVILDGREFEIRGCEFQAGNKEIGLLGRFT